MFKRFMAPILLLTLLSSNINAEVSQTSVQNDTRLKTPLENLMQFEWDLFFKEFSVDFEIVTCGEGLKKSIGFAAHMIEPIGFFEASKTQFNFLFAGITIGNGDPFEQGMSRNDDGNSMFYTHFVMFPLLNKLFDKEMKGVFCFNNNPIGVQYLSEFDLAKDEFFKLKMAAEMAIFFTPQGMVGSIFDCLATETANLVDTRTGYESRVRNAFYFNVGCLGTMPLSWNSAVGNDPLVAAMVQSSRVIHDMHKTTVFKKQVNDAPGPDTMCGPRANALIIKSEYKEQLMYPTVGKSTEIGVAPLEWTSFKNVNGSLDEVVLAVWARRDYAMYAYECGDGSSSTGE